MDSEVPHGRRPLAFGTNHPWRAWQPFALGPHVTRFQENSKWLANVRTSRTGFWYKESKAQRPGPPRSGVWRWRHT
jgi:hypothetical protein